MVTLETGLKLAGAIVAVGGFVLGVANYLETAERNAETRRLEARKIFLDKQLKLYTEVTQTTAKLATSQVGSAAYEAALTRFRELYWGELALVEDRKVESAMVAMDECLDGDCTHCRSPSLRMCALGVAHACRESLATTWGVSDWRR